MSEFSDVKVINNVFLDLIESNPNDNFVAINRISKITNNHLQYAITWAILALLFLVMNYIYCNRNK